MSLSIILPATVIAHSGTDPKTELSKNLKQSKALHAAINGSLNTQQRLELLQQQVRILENRIHTLRDAMIRDFPHVKEAMSRYRINYIDITDTTLVDLKQTLEQMNALMSESSALQPAVP
ncbi:hypothetical protein [Permianibacter aggregans]|uniref:hypothetical protein n=1 Tax=Permianibacter aggregans TaxID=1510150 RepID=UPI00105C86A3|nr:hypothetical protein [Permianibacter aggregans]QGX38192.1 hypothetical protein E2H98_00295 [Permianibacter aggregans]